MPTNQRSKLKYQPDTSNDGVKLVHQVVPVNIFLAAGVVDGEGKKENRLMFRFSGNPQFYFLFPRGVEAAMKPAAGWLQELLEKALMPGNNESLPEDSNDDVAIGDPMEG